MFSVEVQGKRVLNYCPGLFMITMIHREVERFSLLAGRLIAQSTVRARFAMNNWFWERLHSKLRIMTVYVQDHDNLCSALKSIPCTDKCTILPPNHPFIPTYRSPTSSSAGLLLLCPHHLHDRRLRYKNPRPRPPAPLPTPSHFLVASSIACPYRTVPTSPTRPSYIP